MVKITSNLYAPNRHLSYLAQLNFRVFLQQMTTLGGHRFSDIVDIQGHAAAILKSIPEERFQQCFEQWQSL